MKQIQLTKGLFASVDDDDFGYLNQWKWYASKNGRTYYAKRTDYSNGTRKTIYMHSLLLKVLNGNEVDHIDHDGLNNQKLNLREGSHALNLSNQQSHVNSDSKYIGVCKTSFNSKGRRYDYWMAYIYVNGKHIGLGKFPQTEDGEMMAAKARDKAALKYKGEFANLNLSTTKNH